MAGMIRRLILLGCSLDEFPFVVIDSLEKTLVQPCSIACVKLSFSRIRSEVPPETWTLKELRILIT